MTQNRANPLVMILWQGIVLLLLVVLAFFAVRNTSSVVSAEETLRRGALLEPQSSDPNTAYIEIVLPASPLASLSAGFAGIAPSIHLIRLGAARPLSNVDPLEHPSRRRFGRIDLSLAFLLIVPIALLPLSYSLYTQVLGSGRVQQLLEGKIGFFDFFAERIALPLSAWLGILLLAIFASLYSAGLKLDSNQVLVRVSLWLLMLLLYLSGWSLLLGWLLLRAKSYAGAALRYSAIFLLVAIVIPAFAQSIQLAIVRPRERLPLILARRELASPARMGDQTQINRYLSAKGLQLLDPARPYPPGQRVALMNLAAEQQLSAQITALENDFRALDKFAGIASWISPTSLTHFGLDDLAGTGLERYSRFREASIGFLDQWRAYMLPRMVNRQFLDFDALRGAPRFRFQEEPEADILVRAGLRCFFLLAIAITLALMLRGEILKVLPKKANAAR